MTDNSFSLVDLYPKHVINAKGEKKKFDENSIAKILNKETGLDMQIAEKVAEDVIRTIIGLGIDEITTNYIRELVCVELTQRGLNKYRNLFARAINLESIGFKIDDEFINQYKSKQPDWGPIGYITYKRTYARIVEGENRKEEFWETLRRVVEGCYSIQKEHCIKLSLPWSDQKAQKSAQVMFEKIWNFKFSPPGRGLWMMGTEFIARHGSMSLNNCGFASTEDINLKYSKAFEFVMDALMLGVGVGFDTKGAGKLKIQKPTEGTFNFEIEDSREGWVESLKLILEAYFLGKQTPTFDFNKIRLAGTPIRGFGGIASGPKPLREMLEDIQKILEARIGKTITSVDIVDIMNYVGKCVVAGNVRRCISAESKICSKSGLIPIKDIKIGDTVLTSDGKYRKIINKFDQGVQSTIKIITPHGELECTPNHRIAVYSSLQSFEWKMAADLTKTDRLITIPHFEGKNSISPSYAWLIGFYIGDGSAYIRKDYGGEIIFTMTKDRLEGDLGMKCKEILISLGFSPKSYIEKNIGRIKVYSKELALEMLKFKKPKEEQLIPDFIWNGNTEIRSAFLAGLADADGGTRNDLVYSKYPSFLKKIQKIALSLGIVSNINIRPKRKIKGRDKLYEGSHYLKIRGLQSQKRAKELIEPHAQRWFVELRKNKKNGLSIPYQFILEIRNSLDFDPISSGLIRDSQSRKSVYRDANFDTLIENNLVNPDWMPIEILEIEVSTEKQTYDIEVEDNHEFICEGFLVHNSAEIALGDPTDLDFITCKQDEEALYSHRWASNNSVFAVKGLDYSFIADQIAVNGEPGIFWLENARNYSRMGDVPDYKDKKVAGVNPCGEQSLESFELCCVTGDTRIQTRNGAPRIADIVDKEVEVWNGDQWSRVKPFLAAKDKEIHRVYISDGSYLDCTSDHNWHIRPSTARVFRSVETKDLKLGDYVVPFEIDKEFGGIYEPNAFEYGLFSGDGYIDKNYPMVSICGEKSKLKELDVKGTWYKEQIKEGYSEPYNRLNLKDVIDLKLAKHLNDKSRGLPDIVFSWDQESILEFTAGLIETDGNLCHQVTTDNYRIFGNVEKIRDLQILLRRIGINHSTIYSAGDAGEETNYGTRNYTIYCLYIPSYECGEIPTRIKKAVRIGPRYAINNRHPDGEMIDRARKQKITKVEKLKELQLVYCFNEPINHMGIFGNVLTYQCLVETFPSRHESYEEFEETLKYAYLYSKSVTLVNTHWQETNAVMLKNRRMGISQTGIIEAFVKQGRRRILEWCDKAYKYLRELDEQYSNWLCIPKSIKITTVKPSGTVSLLPGVPPGIHYPHSEYYIRRIRLSKNSDLIEHIKNAGYKIEDDSYSPNTVVAEFPIHEKYFNRSKNEVSIWEQAANAIDYQRLWSDNQVSITITFKPEEADQIKHVLQFCEDKLKSASFLPIKEHGYKQAPYEEITKEQYEEMSANTKPLFLDETKDRAIGVKFCDADGVCEVSIDFSKK